MTNDIFIGTCYLSPEQGKKNTDTFSKLLDDILALPKSGHFIINGDLNAKTGNNNDTITPDKFDENLCTSNMDPPPQRNSQDKSINSRGKELLEMCKSLEFYIANGRKIGDPFGNYTCFQWNGNSVVDYLITSAPIFGQVTSLKIGEYLPWLSDHSPLFFTLEILLPQDNDTDNPPPSTQCTPKRYIWKSDDSKQFTKALKSPDIDKALNEISNLDHTNPNDIVEPLTELLMKTAKKANIKEKTSISETKKSNNPPWFDKECKNLKNDVKKMGRKIKSDPSNLKLKRDLTIQKRLLKRTVQKNKTSYKKKFLTQ